MADIAGESAQAVRNNRGMFIAVGVLLLIIGLGAIVFPFMSAISVTLLVGVALVIAGFLQVVHAFSAKGWGGFFWEIVIGLLEIIFGVILLVYPVAGVMTLTLFLAIMFAVEGIARSVMAFQMRPEAGWGWLLASGIASLAIGILLWIDYPGSAIWAIGLLVGINFIMAGWGLIMVASAAGKSTGAEAKA